MFKKINIWARGGLGNQIIEYAVGIGFAIKNDLEYELFFSSINPRKEDNVFHNQEKADVTKLFLFKKSIKINPKFIKKTNYWNTSLIDNYFNIGIKEISAHMKPLFQNNENSNYIALHIRGTDKILSDTNSLYDPLIEEAKKLKLKIKIITDDFKLSSYLALRHGIEFKNSSNSAIEDWLLINNAKHIFSIYSTFSYSTLFLNPDREYTMTNYKISSEFYKNADNEYLAINQLLPYCKNLELIPIQKKIKTFSKSRDNLDNIENLIKIIDSSNSINNKDLNKLRELFKNSKNNFDKEFIENVLQIIYSPEQPFTGLDNFLFKLYLFIQKKITKKYNKYNSLNQIPLTYHLRGIYPILSYINNIESSKYNALFLPTKSNKNINSEIEAFKEKGFLKINNFLNKNNLKELKKLCNSSSMIKKIDSKNKLSIFNSFLNINIAFEKYDEINFIKLLSIFIGIKETEIKKQLKENLFKSSKIEKSKNQLFISDTNFSAYRLFYFFDCKNLENYEFFYAKYSNFFNPERLLQEKNNYLQYYKTIKNYKNKKSMYSPKKLSLKQIKEYSFKSKKIQLQPNTILLINAYGYYRKPNLDISESSFHLECPLVDPSKKFIS